jgi:hypothetical protein
MAPADPWRPHVERSPQRYARFIPDSGRRFWQTRPGWVVVADSDRYLLGLYLTALRSGVFGTGGRLLR